MAFIRSLIQFIWMAASITVVATIMSVGRLCLPEFIRYRVGAWWCNSVIYTLRWICGVKWRIQGQENIPQEAGRRIIVQSKHQSAWETFALNKMLEKDLAFVFKKELLRIPFFGWALGSVDMIHIDRKAGAKAMELIATEGARLMDSGRWMILFPEGTRVPRGESIRYKTGGARAAIAAEADILPVALTSGRCWAKGGFIKRAGTIDVVIGPIITSAGKAPHELTKEVQDWIEMQMRLIDAEAYPNEVAEKIPQNDGGKTN